MIMINFIYQWYFGYMPLTFLIISSKFTFADYFLPGSFLKLFDLIFYFLLLSLSSKFVTDP